MCVMAFEMRCCADLTKIMLGSMRYDAMRDGVVVYDDLVTKLVCAVCNPTISTDL